jgi:hypothetical protein
MNVIPRSETRIYAAIIVQIVDDPRLLIMFFVPIPGFGDVKPAIVGFSKPSFCDQDHWIIT